MTISFRFGRVELRKKLSDMMRLIAKDSMLKALSKPKMILVITIFDLEFASQIIALSLYSIGYLNLKFSKFAFFLKREMAALTLQLRNQKGFTGIPKNKVPRISVNINHKAQIPLNRDSF